MFKIDKKNLKNQLTKDIHKFTSEGAFDHCQFIDWLLIDVHDKNIYFTDLQFSDWNQCTFYVSDHKRFFFVVPNIYTLYSWNKMAY